MDSVNASMPEKYQKLRDRALAEALVANPSKVVILNFRSTVAERERVIEVVAGKPMKVLDYANSTLRALGQRLDALMGSIGPITAAQQSSVIEEDDETVKVSPSERDNFFAKFIKEHGVANDASGSVGGGGLYRMYRDFCASTGFSLEDTYAWFIRRMNKHGFESEQVGNRSFFRVSVNPAFQRYVFGPQVEEEEVQTMTAEIASQTVCVQPTEDSTALIEEIRALREEIAGIPRAVVGELAAANQLS